MEHSSTSIPPPTRLQRVEESHVTSAGYNHHLSHLGARARAGHGLHHQKVQRLWLFRHDAPDADRYVAAEQVG